MLKKLAQAIGLVDMPAEAVARRALLDLHPGWRVQGTRTLATEESRFVVAVFYWDRACLQRPSPHKLFAVSRDL